MARDLEQLAERIRNLRREVNEVGGILFREGVPDRVVERVDDAVDTLHHVEREILKAKEEAG